MRDFNTSPYMRGFLFLLMPVVKSLLFQYQPLHEGLHIRQALVKSTVSISIPAPT